MPKTKVIASGSWIQKLASRTLTKDRVSVEPKSRNFSYKFGGGPRMPYIKCGLTMGCMWAHVWSSELLLK